MRWLKVVPSSSCDPVVLNLVRIRNSISTLKLVGVDILHLLLLCLGLHRHLLGLDSVLQATGLLSPTSSLGGAHRSKASAGGGLTYRLRQSAVSEKYMR